MPKELFVLAILGALVGGFLSYSMLSGIGIISLILAIFLGPIGWGILTNFIPHNAYMGLFLYYFASGIGATIGLVVGYIAKMW